MKSCCASCSHSEVCRLKEELQAFIDAIERSKDSKLVKPQFVDVRITCNYYTEHKIWDQNVKLVDFNPGPMLTPTKASPCETCEITAKLKRGEMVINDRCSFCEHNPMKITCKD